jgi:hypothetical protein
MLDGLRIYQRDVSLRCYVINLLQSLLPSFEVVVEQVEVLNVRMSNPHRSNPCNPGTSPGTPQTGPVQAQASPVQALGVDAAPQAAVAAGYQFSVPVSQAASGSRAIPPAMPYIDV